jgi:hypothetical protein
MRDLAWIIADNKKAQEAYDARKPQEAYDARKPQEAYDVQQTLFNLNQLNRAEAYRRLDTWLAQSSNVHALSATKLLVGVLRKDEQL